MPSPQELTRKFWKALASDRTMMLGLDGVENGHTRPMAAQIENDRPPLWFFAAKDHALVQKIGPQQRAIATFASKGHDLFATVQGILSTSTDRAVVDRLWNRHISAWYPGGKDDPSVVLLRLDAQQAEIWLHESNLFSGAKLLLGADPKKEYAENTAQVRLG
jgi:general stress protein 26